MKLDLETIQLIDRPDFDNLLSQGVFGPFDLCGRHASEWLLQG